MMDKKQHKFFQVAALAAVVGFAMGGATQAASITNNDSESQTLLITEEGVRSELVIAPGETLSICEEGCFMTAPNGDRAVLEGGETVTIANGVAVVR